MKETVESKVILEGLVNQTLEGSDILSDIVREFIYLDKAKR